MLKLLNFELKTYFIRRQFTFMLLFILDPHPALQEASDMLLNIGGAEFIDEISAGGYTILQRQVACACGGEEVISTLSRGPDFHQVGLEYYDTPQEETPIFLTMYSEFAFADWLYGLDALEVDLEKFIERDLERNYIMHVGWEKETLLDLFA